jgi:galactonate dehydratase
MKRREFLRTAAVTALAAPFWMRYLPEYLWGKIPAGMTITGVKTFVVGQKVYVKILTNKGVTGLGECWTESLAHTVDAAIQDLSRIIIGRDPTNIEFIWQALFRWPRQRGGNILNGAISAIEIALWDILGKVLEAPIYKCLGGAARDKVRLYCHVGGKTPKEMAESVRRSVKDEGFTIVRTGIAWSEPVTKRPWNLKLAVSLVEAMREAAGDNVDIIDDAHGLMTPVMVLEYLTAIEPYRMMYVEDPVQPENMDGLKWIRDHTRVPIGIGESNYTKLGFKDIIHNHLANYVRPDVYWAGGISECKKIGAMAEANFIDMTLHGGFSPVHSLASLHVAAATPNCVAAETHTLPRSPEWVKDLFYGDDIVYKDGYAQLPTKPGLGCDLDENVAAKHPYEEEENPHYVYDDGSVSDW